MIQIVGIVAGFAIIAMLFAGAATLTYTGICIVCGFGLGSLVTLIVTYDRFQQSMEREEARRERDHRRMLELLRAGSMLPTEMRTIETPKRLVRR